MQPFFTWLLKINSSDEEIILRGRNLILMILVQFGVALFFLPILLFNSLSSGSLIATIISMLFYLVIFFAARCGQVTAGALMFITVLTVATLGSALSAGQLSVTPFFLLVVLLVAGLTLRPWQIWPVLLLNVVGLILTILALPNSPLADPLGSQVVPSGFALLVVAGLISFLGAQTTTKALRSAQLARKQSETVARTLEQTNATLEAAVAQRTRSLEEALRSVEQREARLVETLAENEQQRIAIREMSVPVIPINKRTMVMPLIGALDTFRLADVRTQATHSIERTGIRYLVLDITGVPIVDSQVAKGLLEVVQAARLLGSEAIIVGTRPEVAQTIVGLGLDLGTIRTFSDLQSALTRLSERHTEALQTR